MRAFRVVPLVRVWAIRLGIRTDRDGGASVPLPVPLECEEARSVIGAGEHLG